MGPLSQLSQKSPLNSFVIPIKSERQKQGQIAVMITDMNADMKREQSKMLGLM